ncbi:hypothetical protein DYU11_18515 [Fibrisoma montanum]|uniref:Uncharacterized protein n=1 Tax=Fibrisoma montanum TaxID=2305895 RepID=A0A418M659_9BACT|nr:hypothetical protein [Fibrisoma montanum]RIV21400.1 hypothetical protein DYU11_18515 [Fibrisoma montanum]
MTTPIDIISTPEGDLLEKFGDLVLGNATELHQYDIVIAHKAWHHWEPTVGVGIRDYLLDERDGAVLNGIVRKELTRDGLVVQSLTVNRGEVFIDGYYDENLLST